jgi:phosphoribosylformylglycinamidine synthase subunit PurS
VADQPSSQAATSSAATSTRWLARIHVTLKPVVNDPQGLAVMGALHQLGYGGVESVRLGKYLELQLAASDRAAAEAQVDEMCRRLLANPVIEDYRDALGEVADAPAGASA